MIIYTQTHMNIISMTFHFLPFKLFKSKLRRMTQVISSDSLKITGLRGKVQGSDFFTWLKKI